MLRSINPALAMLVGVGLYLVSQLAVDSWQLTVDSWQLTVGS
ncbi:hypothetical protein [Microcoleus sp. B4-D4]